MCEITSRATTTLTIAFEQTHKSSPSIIDNRSTMTPTSNAFSVRRLIRNTPRSTTDPHACLTDLRRIQQHFALLEKASHEVVEKLKDDEKPKTFNAEELEDAHDRDELEPNSHQ